MKRAAVIQRLNLPESSFSKFVKFAKELHFFRDFLSVLNREFQEIEKNIIVDNNLKQTLESATKADELDKIQPPYLTYLIEQKVVSIRWIVNKFKDIEYQRPNSDKKETSLWMFLAEGSGLDELCAKETLQKEELKCLFSAIDTPYEFTAFFENTSAFRLCLKTGAVSFRRFADKAKRLDDLHSFLSFEDNFKFIFDNECLIRQSDIPHLLNMIDCQKDLVSLAYNEVLLNYVFDNFLITATQLEKYNELVKKMMKSDDNSSFFSYARTVNDRPDVLEGLKLNEQLHHSQMSETEKTDMLQTARSNKKACNVLKQLLHSNTFDLYTFEEVQELLVKDNEKKKFKMNF